MPRWPSIGREDSCSLLASVCGVCVCVRVCVCVCVWCAYVCVCVSVVGSVSSLVPLNMCLAACATAKSHTRL